MQTLPIFSGFGFGLGAGSGLFGLSAGAAFFLAIVFLWLIQALLPGNV
ncbi:MAG: hypothetical protein WC378_17820 [Opitutaceae bacterium]